MKVILLTILVNNRPENVFGGGGGGVANVPLEENIPQQQTRERFWEGGEVANVPLEETIPVNTLG